MGTRDQAPAWSRLSPKLCFARVPTRSRPLARYSGHPDRVINAAGWPGLTALRKARTSGRVTPIPALAAWRPLPLTIYRVLVTHQPFEVPRKEVGWDQPLWAQAHHLSPDSAKRGGPAVQSDLVPPYVLPAADVLRVLVARYGPQLTSTTRGPSTSHFGRTPRPGAGLASMKPLTRCGAPSAVLTVT